MRPIRLTLQNYRSFQDVDLDLSGIEAAAITGPNGAGKTCLAESVLYALYGEGRSSTVDGVVRLGERESSVKLEYLHDGATYAVIRKRSRGQKSELQYLVRGPEDELWWALSGASIAETQGKIVHDLAMDGALFRHSSFVGQGESAAFCEATPAERKAVLYGVLEDRLAQFAALHEAAKATVKTLDEALAVAAASRERLQTLIALRETTETARTGAQEQLDLSRGKVAEGEERTNTLRESLAQHEAALNRLAAARAECSKLEAEVADLGRQRTEWQTVLDADQALLREAEVIRRDAEAADRLEAELKEFAERRQALQLAESAHEKTNLQCMAAQDAYKRALDQAGAAGLVPCLGTDEAVTCPLLAQARASTSEEELTRIADQWRAAEQTLKDRLTEARKADGAYDDSAHREAQADYDTRVWARPELANLAGAEARAEGAKTALREVARRLETNDRDLAALRQECLDLEYKTAGAEQLAESLRFAERLLEEARCEVESYTREFAVYDERLRQVAEAEVEVGQIDQQVAAQAQSRTIYATLQEAFSRDGIPALIIDATVPAVEEIANEILAGLSDGRMTLKLTTQRLKVTGGIAETLEIIVADQLGERLYEDWSGGEKLRVDLAVRIALGRLLAQRTGAPVELLVLDECCAPLDEAGEDALIDCVMRLLESFGCILVITHRNNLRDRLPQQIVVEKNGGASTAVVVA
jgi:exonuclease SbcC